MRSSTGTSSLPPRAPLLNVTVRTRAPVMAGRAGCTTACSALNERLPTTLAPTRGPVKRWLRSPVGCDPRPFLPLQGHPGRVVDTRELVVPRTPFTVAYRVRGQIVEVVGIVHQ